MITVTAPARLHFGLFTVGGEPGDRWPDHAGRPALPARRFGGVGLMVDAPALRLVVRPAPSWGAVGPMAARALEFAHTFDDTLMPGQLSPQLLEVQSASPEHRGFGSGTQLAMAVSRALATAAGLSADDPVDLARRVGRGRRSALGIHGSWRGGFLVEGGKGDRTEVAPLLAHAAFPEAWRVVIVVPPVGPGRHGMAETDAFRRLPVGPPDDALCRLVLLGMLPALAEQDAEAFGEALHDFNHRVGLRFAAAQGGPYAGPAVTEVVGYLRGLGIAGVGQSSWGPAVFALVADADRAENAAERLRRRFGLSEREVYVTRANADGSRVERPS